MEVLSSRSFVFRELTSPGEIAASLRLRQKIYESHEYEPAKPLDLDISEYDVRSRMYGLFRYSKLVGGVRFTRRERQPIAPTISGMLAVVPGATERDSSEFPSERAFAMNAALGPHAALVDGELGRLHVDRDQVGAGRVMHRLVLATLATLIISKVRLFLYSASTERAKSYGKWVTPRWVLDEAVPNVFPVPSVCSVASAPQDFLYLPEVVEYSEQLMRTGEIVLPSEEEP